MTSQSLALGRSYLPVRIVDVPVFISSAAGAIERNPAAAAEIALAATQKLLNKLNASSELKHALTSLVNQSCKARDHSVQ